LSQGQFGVLEDGPDLYREASPAGLALVVPLVREVIEFGATAVTGRSVQRRRSFGPDPVHHGNEAAGALGGEVFAKAQFVEKGDGVVCGDLFDRGAGIGRNEDSDEALADDGIGFAAIGKGRASVRSLRLLGGEPDLLNAAMDLVFRSLVGRIEPRQPLA